LNESLEVDSRTLDLAAQQIREQGLRQIRKARLDFDAVQRPFDILKNRLCARATFMAALRDTGRQRHQESCAAGRRVENPVLSRPNAGLHHRVDGVMREMRRREIGCQSSLARLRHQQRIEARNPIMPLVIRQARKKCSDRAVGKPLVDDRLADLERRHARALQLGSDGAEIAHPPIERQALFLLSCSLTLYAHAAAGPLSRETGRALTKMTRG
jgi:hypothetical protein